MQIVKKITLLSLILLFSSNVFAIQPMNSETCGDEISTWYWPQLENTKEQLKNELEICFSYPQGEEFEECRYMANQVYQNLKDGLDQKRQNMEKWCWGN